MLPAALGAVRTGRVVARRGQQRQGAQPRVGHLALPRRLSFHRTQHEPFRLGDLAGAHEGGGGQRGRGRVGVGQHRRRCVEARPLPVPGGHGGGLVQQFLDVLPQPPVVEPEYEAEAGVEPTGGEGGADVGLVVVVDERQGRRPVGSHLGEDGLGDLRSRHDLLVRGRFTARAGSVDRRVHDPVEQRRRGRPGPSDHGLAHPSPGGRYDERDLLAVDTAEFGGQPVREPVVTAHDHVRGRISRLTLVRNAPHEEKTASPGRPVPEGDAVA